MKLTQKNEMYMANTNTNAGTQRELYSTARVGGRVGSIGVCVGLSGICVGSFFVSVR